ncbi:hypothetical protein [Enterovirga aerilata]|uniref:Uncharacterized protein n=1 Tax=Enterovirga aerilata TaxID=2730920 RepID=A0A849I4K7_9HYPH|nr:hypothetical protein [Enterovirga sp. DB1703]NNM74766.1 hypothetical protein [Enterovirga sp. DB1703]
MDTVSIEIPFPGFYHSILSDELDYVEEQEIEYFAEHRQAEEGVPEELRLDAFEYGDILMRHTDYSVAHERVAKAWVDGFNLVAEEMLGFNPGFVFEETTSPREYNFETDRVFARCPVDTVRKLRAMVDPDRLAEVMRERHTSRSGFISFYSPDLADWPDDVTEWDHNQLGTLLRACLPEDDRSEEGVTWRVFYAITDDGGFYWDWSEAVDWKAVEAAVNEARDEKLAEIRADDPDYEAPAPRCPYTGDLFRFAESRA